MKGSIVKRGKGKWSLVFDAGFGVNKKGKYARIQKWVKFTGTAKQAETKLNDLVHAANRNELVEPSKMTVATWLDEWIEQRKPSVRPRTYDTYKCIITAGLKPGIGSLVLQSLRPVDLQRYYADRAATLKPASLKLHHAVMTGALESAVKRGLVARNVTKLVEGLPKIERKADDIIDNCWTADEARKFLSAAKADGPRPAALYALALDSGARRAELLGLLWKDIEFDKGTVAINRQLATTRLADDGTVRFGPTKRGVSRTLKLGDETISLLRSHKAHQAEIKMANRGRYVDLGLIFAKEVPDLTGTKDGALGEPIQMGRLNNLEVPRLCSAAGIRRIKLHGLRHTAASLMLANGVPVNVVARRLGHSNAIVTMTVYAHVLPHQDDAAAKRLGTVLHG